MLLGKIILGMSTASGIGFLIIALHELDYANSHPFADGPAKVIAWCALAGAVLAIAVALVGYALVQMGRESSGPQ